MGLFRKSSDNYAPLYSITPQSTPTDGNPKADNFSVVKHQVHGDYIVVVLRYPDAINYEGRKLLVFENVAKFWERANNRDIDPHFLENRFSPIARFEPTDRGWAMAMSFVSNL